MTQDNYTEGVDTPDESMDDSPVIKALRKQVRDLETALKGAPTRESIEAELRTKLEREKAISDLLVDLGHPAGMSDLLQGRLGETEVTRESVAEALRSIGYQVEIDGAASNQEEQPAPNPDLAGVADLSAQVRSAALGQDSRDIASKIAQAQTPEELARLAAEGGFLQSHT